MVDFKEKCTGCAHHAMCKYSDLYNKQYKHIADYIHDLEEDQSDQVCNVEITCKYYMAIKPAVRSNF